MSSGYSKPELLRNQRSSFGHTFLVVQKTPAINPRLELMAVVFQKIVFRREAYGFV
jgi:hypothetical protein